MKKDRLMELAGIQLNENEEDVDELRAQLVNLLMFTTSGDRTHIKKMVYSVSMEDLKKESDSIRVIATKIAQAANTLGR